MEGLLRDFGGMIPLIAMSVPLGTISWQLLAKRRKRRQESAAGFTAGVDVSLALTSCLVLCLVIMPIPHNYGSLVELTPGSDLGEAFNDRDALWQLIGNLILLAPLGALLPLRNPALRSLPRMIFSALAVSVMIEFTQFVIQAGRVSSTDDVLLNTMGATLGAIATRYWWRATAAENPAVVIPVQQRRIIGQPLAQPTWLEHASARQKSMPHHIPHCRDSELSQVSAISLGELTAVELTSTP